MSWVGKEFKAHLVPPHCAAPCIVCGQLPSLESQEGCAVALLGENMASAKKRFNPDGYLTSSRLFSSEEKELLGLKFLFGRLFFCFLFF